MSSTHLALHYKLPLDRELHKALVKAVLEWTGNPGLPPANLQQIEQIALLLADAARALSDAVLKEADRRLSVPAEGTAHGAPRTGRGSYALCTSAWTASRAVAPQAVTAP
ncbi:hypothetical protein [Streptomyces seoulensis]|uniref:hypothetical protein n=1 Tax=Streptomyces seoulensis TaxID=73044 RepID=UPI0033A5F863